MHKITQLPNGDFMDFDTGMNFFLSNCLGDIHWRLININIPNPTSCAITYVVSDTPANRKQIYQELLKLFAIRGYTIEYLDKKVK